MRPTRQRTYDQIIPDPPLDVERRIRRGMRLHPRLWTKKRNSLRTTIARVTLVAGGILLGWTGSALWHE